MTRLALSLAAAGALLAPSALAQDPDFLWAESGPDRVVRLANVDGESNGTYGNDAGGIEKDASFVRGYATANSVYACAVDTSVDPAKLYYYDRSNGVTGGNPNGEGVYLAQDVNRTGRMDYAEVTPFWPANGSDLGGEPAILMDSAGNVVVACDLYGGGIPGIYVLNDLNSNGFIDLGTAEEVLLTGTSSSLTTVDGLTLSVDDFELLIEDSAGFLLGWEDDDDRVYRMKDLNGSGLLGDVSGEVTVFIDLNSSTGGVLPSAAASTNINSLEVDLGAGPGGRDLFYVGSYNANVHDIFLADDANGDASISLGSEIALWADVEALTGFQNPFIGDIEVFGGEVWVQANFSFLSLDIYRLSDSNSSGVIEAAEFVQAYTGPSAFIDVETFCAVPDGIFADLRDARDAIHGSVALAVNPVSPGSATPAPGIVPTPNSSFSLSRGDTFQFEFTADDQVAADLMDLTSFPIGFVLWSTGLNPPFTLPASGLRSTGIRFDSFTNLSATALAPLLNTLPSNSVTPLGTYTLTLPGIRVYYVGITRDASFNWGNISQVDSFLLN
ncbi:MAG: hypothetical protein RL885_04115 [Planctomycetota bacterium]